MEKESELQLLQSKKAEMDEATIQEFQRTKAKLLDYMSQTGKLKAANTRLRFENEELKKRLAEQVDEYKKLLEEKMQDFEEQLKNLEDQALLKDYKIKEDKILIDEKSSIIAKLSRKNSESDDLISAHSQRLKHLEEECRNKDVKISQLTQTNENLGLRNNELIRNYESACKNLEVDSRTLQSELDETCNVLQQKSSECDRLKEEKRNLDLVWASSEKELQQVKAKLSEVVEKLKNVEMESNEKVALLEKELSIKTEHLTKDTKLNMRLKEKDDLIEKLQWTLLQMDNSTEKTQLEEASNAKLHLIKLAGIGNKTLKETTWEELFDALAVTKKKVENQIEEYQNNMSALQEQIESIKLAREQERQRFYQKINEATEKKDINAASSLSIAKSVEIQDAYLADISNDSSEIEQLRRENERLRRTIQTNTIIAKNEQHKYRELESKYSKLEQELELRSVKRRVEENNQQDNVRPSLGKKRTIARILDGRQVEIGTRERVKNKQSE
ncbi:hypothetical protein HK098_004926 [Nowakowskiella sp. JEL0407]|nr:hypothetical protein HK098_004926 [Nowakowskiella sp. JEL0407]